MGDSIILVTIDCLRPDHMSTYDYRRETTPHIDSVADSGSYITNFYSNGPGTRFAFKSILGGILPLKIKGVGLPQKCGITLPELLSSRGYETAGFVDNPFLTEKYNYDRGFDAFYDSSHWRQSEKSEQGKLDLYRNFAKRLSDTISRGRLYNYLRSIYDSSIVFAESRGIGSYNTDGDIVSKSSSWIKKMEKDEKKYFAWVHLMSVHGPHSYYEKHRDALNVHTNHIRHLSDQVNRDGYISEAGINTYDASIRKADSLVGKLISVATSDPIILITSDHGEEFGSHHPFHTPSPYDSMSRVPLIVKPEGVATGSEISTHRDIPVTIAKSVGAPLPESWRGGSICQYSSTKPTEQHNGKHITIGFEISDKNGNRKIYGGIVDPDGYKIIVEQKEIDSEPECLALHNIKDNPAETINIKGRRSEKKSDLLREWTDTISAISDERLTGAYSVWNQCDSGTSPESRDEYKLDEQLQHLGYK